MRQDACPFGPETATLPYATLWPMRSRSPSIADIQQTNRVVNMNRQKKLKQLFREKAKKASAKLAPKKEKYISKADRLKMAEETAAEPVVSTDS